MLCSLKILNEYMIDQRQKVWVGLVESREELVESEKQQQVIIFAEVFVKKKKGAQISIWCHAWGIAGYGISRTMFITLRINPTLWLTH